MFDNKYAKMSLKGMKIAGTEPPVYTVNQKRNSQDLSLIVLLLLTWSLPLVCGNSLKILSTSTMSWKRWLTQPQSCISMKFLQTDCID